MNRPTLRKVALGAVIALSLISALVAIPFVGTHISDASGRRWTVRGHLVPAVRGLKTHAIADTSQAIEISIALSLRNQSALTALIAAQNNPRSPFYHRYLTPREFSTRFSPTPATVNRVTAWLRSQGLLVHAVSSNRTLISASGSMAAVEQAFAMTLADYQVNGRTVYAPAVEPSVPDTLTGVIVGIAGLDDVGVYTHAPIISARVRRTDPHFFDGPGNSYTPDDLRTAYDMDNLISHGANGTGQTVAIFELDGYKASDVNAFLYTYNLGPARYSNVLVDGATNAAGAGAIEVELDMEVVSGTAYGASQKIYIGPNTTTGVNDTYNKIVTDNIAKVTSTSWGLCEAFSGTAELQTLDNIFAQGAAQGQAFFAASGDSGAYDCNNNNLAVDSPADDPYVVGAGGTHMLTDDNRQYSSESVWSDPSDTSRSPKGAGGGGGLSTYFAKPSYQTGPGTTNAYSNGKRQTPDISADADPNTGYAMYCTVTASGCSSATPWLKVGGTSAAAPLWAGIAADLNQYLAANSKPTLGSASATLYTLFNTSQEFAPYHDITSGNNLYYPATAGYDQASGIGTPDVWHIARDLVPSDFSLTSSPDTVTLTQTQNGNNTTTTLNTGVTAGVADSISLSASVSPAGPNVSTCQTPITAGNWCYLYLSFGPTVPIGVYTVTVTGIEGRVTHSITVTLNIVPQPPDDFSISASPTSLTITQSTSATATISSAVVSGYTGYLLDLSTSVSPPGPTVSLNPAFSVVVGNSTTLTVQVDSEVASGNYTVTITALGENSDAKTHSTTVTITVLSNGGDGIVNGGFETGDLSGWATTGVTAISGTGPYSVQIGSTAPYRGDSSISQTFTATSGYGLLTYQYTSRCIDSVNFDWVTATLKDNSTGATIIILGKTCAYVPPGTLVSARVTAGHSYTLTITVHDDNYPTDPTYIHVDNVTLWTAAPQPFVNGGFETGDLTGWTTAGATAISATGHSGGHSAQVGSTAPFNGDSSISQAVAVPTGTTRLTFWYKVACSDTVAYDWAMVTLHDDSLSGIPPVTIVRHTCTNNDTWVNVTVNVIAGHNYTLSFIAHDDDWVGDPTYLLLDDVSIS